MYDNNIYLFDIRSREHEKIDIKTLLHKKISDDKRFIEYIEQGYIKIGLRVNIELINQPELLVRTYFERQGYTVLKTFPIKRDDGRFLEICPEAEEDEKIIIKYLEENFKFFERKDNTPLIHYLNKGGVPDFLVYRKEHPKIVHDLFFVEVKNWHDGLKGNQILWMFQNNVPVKIAYLD